MKRTALLPVLSLVVAFLLVVSICWLSLEGQERLPPPTARQLLMRQGRRMVSKEFLQLAAIDLNKATAEELEAIPGIGPVLSQRIVDFRHEHGFITDIDRLDDVFGIGEKTLRVIDEHGYIVPANADGE